MRFSQHYRCFFNSGPTALHYLEEPLEGRIGDVVDLENVLLLAIVNIFNQHHGVDEGVHSRQLGVWKKNKKYMFSHYFSNRKTTCSVVN